MHRLMRSGEMTIGRGHQSNLALILRPRASVLTTHSSLGGGLGPASPLRLGLRLLCWLVSRALVRLRRGGLSSISSSLQAWLWSPSRDLLSRDCFSFFSASFLSLYRLMPKAAAPAAAILRSRLLLRLPSPPEPSSSGEECRSRLLRRRLLSASESYPWAVFGSAGTTGSRPYSIRPNAGSAEST